MSDVTYVVDKHLTDRAEAAAACDAVLDVLGPRVASATIDAYSDYQDAMTYEATGADPQGTAASPEGNGPAAAGTSTAA